MNAPGPEISRHVLEMVAIEGFRTGQLTTAQIKDLLGFESRSEVYDFLAEHKVPWVDYSIESAESERSVLKALLSK